MALQLTPKGTSALIRIKARYNALLPEYGRNTFDRVVYEMGNISASMIIYAIGVPSDDDKADLIRDGYAK